MCIRDRAGTLCEQCPHPLPGADYQAPLVPPGVRLYQSRHHRPGVQCDRRPRPVSYTHLEAIARKRYNKYGRPADNNKKYGRAWKRIRDRYAAAHSLCEMCLKEGRLTPVEEVHHIVPVSYTHLDVYKRQGSKNFGVQREREVGVLPSPDRLSKDHFSSFFSSN